MTTENWITVGRIRDPHGLRGWVNVTCLSDFPERLMQPGSRWLQPADGAIPVEVKLLEGIPQPKGHYRVLFDLINSRTLAEQWQGAQVLVPATARPHLEPEEYYASDLIGLIVRDRDREIGTVTAIDTGGNDVLTIKLSDGDTVLIPFAKAIVPVVDLEAGYLEITPPKGLLPEAWERES